MNETKRQKLDILCGELDREASSFLSHYRQLSDNILPRRARFTITDVNKGERRNSNIVDGTAPLALRTLKSGMMGGITSPARPWFKLTTPDPATAELGPVKTWLARVEENMAGVFLRSNLYKCLPTVYGDIATFATAAMYVEEDFENVLHFHVFPVGSYRFACDAKGRPNTFKREYQQTVRQLVEKYCPKTGRGENERDFSNVSSTVKDAWMNGKKQQWVDVVHVIRPNDEYDPDKLHSKYKKYYSCTFEKSAGQANGQAVEDKFLKESGYDYFPVFIPRWEVTGEDDYGTDCPGMTALGDIKQLQVLTKKIAQAIEKMVNPPLKGPGSLVNRKVSLLPGDFTADDSRDGKGLSPIHEVGLRVAEAQALVQEIQARIKDAFFVPIFLMFSGDERVRTATEISERKEEKLLMLGSVLEQLNQDLLDPLIDIAFQIMLKQSTGADGQLMEGALIPPFPEELQGINLKVEYVSIMAAAQKAQGLAGLERFLGTILQVAPVVPSVTQKVDFDQFVDEYGTRAGVPISVILEDEKVAAMRAQIAKQQQAQAAAEQMERAAGAANKLAGADMEGDNALTRLVDSANAGALAPAS